VDATQAHIAVDAAGATSHLDRRTGSAVDGDDPWREPTNLPALANDGVG